MKKNIFQGKCKDEYAHSSNTYDYFVFCLISPVSGFSVLQRPNTTQIFFSCLSLEKIQLSLEGKCS